MGEKTVCIDNEIPFSIPSSWCWQRLCSVCFINPSVNTDDASEVSFVTMKDIQAGFVNSFSSSKTLWKSVKTNFTHFQNEDIGLAKITPCFENRKSVIFKGLINGIGAGTTELNIIRVDQRILLNEYLLYLLKSDYLINYGISKFTGAVGQQRFGGIALKQFLIPIPPFEEQKRLCNTIVGCLQYANSIGKNLSELNKNGNTLKSKILDSFFGEHSRYKSYYGKRTETTLEKLIPNEKIGDGDWVLSEDMNPNGDIQLLQLKHIGNMVYHNKSFCHIDENFFKEHNCSEIKENYLLINRLVASSMACCLMPQTNTKTITSVDVCWIAPDETYNSKYIMYYLSSKNFQNKVLMLCSGSTRKRISKKNLTRIPLFIHDRIQQDTIVNRIENLFELVEKVIG